MIYNRESGFTLFELMIGMMIISIFIAPFVYKQTMEFDEDMIGIAVSEITDLFQSSQNYAAEQGGNWPGEGTNCANAIAVLQAANYLLAFNTRSPYQTNYIPSCTTGNGKRFIVTIDAMSNGKAELLASNLPSSTVTGTNVSVSVPLPESIPAMTHLLPRDGSRPMTGNLGMGGNNIDNLNNLNASGDVKGARFVDNNDPSYSLDPNNRSHLNAMDIRSIRDKDDPAYTLDPNGRSQLNTMDIFYLRDKHNTGFTWDGSGTSRMNYADLNFARLRNTYSVGGACVSKQIGTTSTGELLSCVSGKWVKPLNSNSYAKGSITRVYRGGAGGCPSGTTAYAFECANVAGVCDYMCVQN